MAIYLWPGWWDSRQATDDLKDMAGRYPTVFTAFMTQFGRGHISDQLVRDVAAIAACGEDSAVRVLSLLALPDGKFYSYLSSRALAGLARLAGHSREALEAVLANPGLPEELTIDDRLEVTLLALEQVHPAATSAIRELPWVQEALALTGEIPPSQGTIIPPRSYRETSVLHLVELRWEAESAFWPLLAKPWVNDDFQPLEYSITNEILDIALWHEGSAAKVVGLEFLGGEQQGAESLATLEMLGDLLRPQSFTPSPDEGPSALDRLLASPELAGDITSASLGVAALVELEGRNPDARAAVDKLSWVGDGIDVSEQAAVIALRKLAVEGETVFWELLEKSWVHDGLTERETGQLSEIGLLGVRYLYQTVGDEEGLREILRMPFLDSIDDLDILVLRAANDMELVRSLSKVLAYPQFSGGITDELADTFVALHLAKGYLFRLQRDMILDPEQTAVVRRTIELPLRGEVNLSVIWPGKAPTDQRPPITLDLLELAVRSNEEFMGEPFPKGHAVVLVWELDNFRQFSAQKDGLYGIHANRYSGAPFLAFQSATTYWHDAPRWVRWGVATLLERIVTRGRGGLAVPQERFRCELTNNIAELERIRERIPRTVYSSACDYVLGRGMFHRLYDQMGPEFVQEGLKRLYQRYQDDSLRDLCQGIDKAVCHMKAAFVDSAEGDDADRADAIINGWYYGRSP